MTGPVVCDKCREEFVINRFIKSFDVLRDGTPLAITSFECPACGQMYTVHVEDEQSEQLRDNLRRAQERYRDCCYQTPINTEQERQLKQEIATRKQALYKHEFRLKKHYMKRLKKYGKS